MLFHIINYLPDPLDPLYDHPKDNRIIEGLGGYLNPLEINQFINPPKPDNTAGQQDMANLMQQQQDTFGARFVYPDPVTPPPYTAIPPHWWWHLVVALVVALVEVALVVEYILLLENFLLGNFLLMMEGFHRIGETPGGIGGGQFPPIFPPDIPPNFPPINPPIDIPKPPFDTTSTLEYRPWCLL